jgi:hypothetical protein
MVEGCKSSSLQGCKGESVDVWMVCVSDCGRGQAESEPKSESYPKPEPKPECKAKSVHVHAKSRAKVEPGRAPRTSFQHPYTSPPLPSAQSPARAP